jgi:hypothetical protein
MLAGDYQADGIVSAPDYNLWRATFGSAKFPGVAADGNSSGTTDAGDYVLWRKSASLPVGQRSVAVELPTTLTIDAVSPPTSEIVLPKALAAISAEESADITRRSSSRVWRSAAITTDRIEWDDALVAWISSARDQRRQSDEPAALNQRDELRSNDETPPLLAAFDAIFASLAL